MANALAQNDSCRTPAHLGPYEVVGSIAKGGMGVVLRGRHQRDGGIVALKTVRSPTKGDAASMSREITALGQLSHPGIVRLIADGTTNGMPWMAMELLQGRTVCEEIESMWWKPSERSLAAVSGPRPGDDLPTAPARGRPSASPAPAVVRTARPLPAAGRLRDVIGIVAQLCRALDHIHALGLVHRDVKPANVFLCDDGRVTLLDFGLVCGMAGTVAFETAEICVGTMEYAAPEQIRGSPVDARADIYSLGCLLYELVTGQRPVDTEASSGIVQRQLARDPAAPSELVSSIPSQLESLLLAMLAKRPDERPATAREVGDTLSHVAVWLDDEPAGP
jgi:eukaryotic-like serine/threonine-protein kinase